MCISCVIFLVCFYTHLIFLSNCPYFPYTIHLTLSLSHHKVLTAKGGVLCSSLCSVYLYVDFMTSFILLKAENGKV